MTNCPGCGKRCRKCKTEMEWISGNARSGQIKLQCPKCHWTTHTRSETELAYYLSQLQFS